MNTTSTDSRSIELTDAMWDAISSAMADYADYGDQEATIADEIQYRIGMAYRSAEWYKPRLILLQFLTLFFFTMNTQTYNGWANYETWNVALWLGNDEGMYNLARTYAKYGYKSLSRLLVVLFGHNTPDGVRWDDDTLDHAELTKMLEELIDWLTLTHHQFLTLSSHNHRHVSTPACPR